MVREHAMLYIVATPIGNLSDITLRALETLRTVDYVASEDTRRTGVLLKHYQIKKRQISFHEHNEHRAGKRITGLLKQGQSVALVSNAGTPAISDPGFTLIRAAIEEDIPITIIPGASAFIPALLLSGLPMHSFVFRGFPPRKTGKRRQFLSDDKFLPYTLIYYESPYRVRELVKDALFVLGNRPAALAKELTKVFESVHRGTLSEVLETLEEKPKGEYVLVIAGATT